MIENFNKFETKSNSKETVKKVNEQVEIFGNLTPVLPKTLPTEIETTLNARIGDEYSAYFFYKNAANWCKGVNYPKAASFFEEEAEKELKHAQALQDYLTQWNSLPMIPPAPTVRSFSSLVDLINQAYALEIGLLEKYQADQQAFLSIHPGTFNFIQKYVDFQTEEVAEYSDYLNALQLINTDNKLDLLFFEDKYFG